MVGYRYLKKVNKPTDLKKFNYRQLQTLSDEIREFLLASVSKTGGHLASNLGSVELTVAMHKVFDCPQDQFVWDVGHQAYTHKILTGRRNRFDTLRKQDGISGFPRESESPYDCFVSGHAGTSISVAFGLASAKAICHDEHHVVAVIGDGALTCGQAYEALNNAGRSHTNLIVIINDNEMSISQSVGALANYLTNIRSKQGYFDLKDGVSDFLDAVPLIGTPTKKLLSNTKQRVKTAIYNTNIFEGFGFTYLGPYNGHDMGQLCRVLQRAKSLHRPCIIHVHTKKGKGYPFAETDPSAYHGVSSFDAKVGKSLTNKRSFTDVFSDELLLLAQNDKSVCAVTAAMPSSTGLLPFGEKYPTRLFDVGIAEEHAVTFSAALARNGMKPVCALYSTFLQRGYDQVLHDTCIENRHVVFAVDRAGLVGDDGVTHQGLFDVAFMRQMPHMTIYSPAGYQELRMCLRKAVNDVDGPVVVRYPRGEEASPCRELAFDTEQWVKGSTDLLLVTYGRIYEQVAQVADDTGASVLRLVKVSPLDEDVIKKALSYRTVCFIEEGIRNGGVGEAFAERLLENGYTGRFYLRAVENFVEHATVLQSMKTLGLDCDSLKEWIAEKVKAV